VGLHPQQRCLDQQGSKLVGSGAVGAAFPFQGYSVALSADGNTAIVGGPYDNSFLGAAWVYTRNNGVWTQQSAKLVGTGAVGPAHQGEAVALSGDGSTAIVGGWVDNSQTGAAWVFTRSNGVWTQQGAKLVGTGAVGQAGQGNAVSLSGGGNTAIVGGYYDNSSAGATWVYTRSNGVWTQQGSKLVGTSAVGPTVWQGYSVALSAGGNTAIVGGCCDNSNTGAAWVFVQPGLQVTPATDTIAAGNQGGPFTPSSFQYQLSASAGSINYSISGLPTWLTATPTSGTASSGTPVTFTVNSNANSIAPGTYGPITIAFTNADTGVGTQIRTATLTVNPSALQVTPTTNISASGPQGGPFTPASFSYTLSVRSGSVNYSIPNVPPWLMLTPSSTGTVSSSSPTTVTFTVNANANSLTPNTYVNSINFNNTTNGQGNTTRVATLTVNAPPALQVTPATNMAASGTQGGPFSPSSFQYQVSASAGSVNYSISGLPNWLTASSTSGTATPSASTVTFTVNPNASGLAAGTYGPFAITFTNSDTGQGTQTRMATLTVNAPALQVAPTSNIVVAGNQGALPPSSFPYALSANAGTVNYSISGVPNWLTPSSTSGNVSSSGTVVTFTVNTSADSLAPGTYGPTTIIFTNTDTGQSTQSRTATLIVNPPALQVSPATGTFVSGAHGGPFSPSSFRYSLSSTFGSVKYSITTPSWLTTSPASATVTTSAKIITFTVNSKARSLGPGTYTGNIGFNNTTSNQGNTTRVATLIVSPKQYRLTVSALPAAYGTVIGAGTFAEGNSVTVTGTPNGSHSFVNWTQSGQVVSTSASYTFSMPSANTALTAHFK
jgi:hypothetical protein